MKAFRLLSLLALSVALSCSGCVLEQTRDLLGISGTMYLPHDDVFRINFTAAKVAMAAKGFSVKVYPAEWNPPGAPYDNGAEISRKGDFVFDIASWTMTGSQKALASGFYNGSKGDFKTDGETEAAKRYMRSEMSQIAQNLNLTVDWSQVKWSVNLGPVR